MKFLTLEEFSKLEELWVEMWETLEKTNKKVYRALLNKFDLQSKEDTKQIPQKITQSEAANIVQTLINRYQNLNI